MFSTTRSQRGRSPFARHILIGAGLVSSLYASAQDAGTASLTGKVYDQKTKEALIGATVRTLPDGQVAQTGADGSFELPLPDGARSLVVTYVGYVSDTVKLAARTGPVSIGLSEAALLEEVRITSRRKSTELNTLGAIKVERIGSKELMKAACCNLSESFETTPSVDVGFTDAVSGYKQIQMLGLAGTYTSFTRENVPDIRGLAAITGLAFTPGAWVESMQLSKGAGSVVNGYEGTAGQINIEWRKPFAEDEPRLFLNGYQSVQGRSEGNVVWSHKLSDALSTNLLLHGRGDWAKIDGNKDGFLDQPLGSTFVGANRWFYFDPRGWEVQGGVKGVYLDNTGGQKDYEKGMPLDAAGPWGYEQQIKRVEGWAKIGKVFPDKPGRSMGLQLSGLYHDQAARYGDRTYDARQKSFYANYIYQTLLGTSDHVLKMGASFQADGYDETFVGDRFVRNEYVPGAFAEYSYNYLTKFNVVAGLRADHHNLFGTFLTPRLHLRYALHDNSVFRASLGRAQRTAHVFAENIGFLASNRSFVYERAPGQGDYGFKPEVAWNMGLNFTQKFMLNYRDGAFSADYYYTDFQNQVIVDVEKPGSVRFYNLDGRSFAHSFQAQLDYEPVRKFDVRLAYRYYYVRNTYDGVLKEKPLLNAHRAFVNLAYEAGRDWRFDYTVQWIGPKRVPLHWDDQGREVGERFSQAFVQMNAQVSKSWKDGAYEVYLGGENLTNYMQKELIIRAADPAARAFDGSMIWGPGMGRNLYAGFRVKIK